MSRTVSSSVCSSRSVYVSRLRRALLLRVHPDRFACADQRTKQAAFVQAFHQRISASDFLDWQRRANLQAPRATRSHNDEDEYTFALERRDGTLLHKHMVLNDSVSNILSNISSVLRESGATSIPLPPNDGPSNKVRSHQQQILNQFASPRHREPSTNSRSNGLHKFLRSIDPAFITSRQQARWDAKTVATSVRKTFGFVAVDATRTHWSSQTVAALLRRFVSVSKSSFSFRVGSFSPLRLVWSPTAREVSMASDNHDEPLSNRHVDVYDGTLYLNPSATSVQWAQTLQTINTDTLQLVQRYHAQRQERSQIIQRYFGGGIIFRKGFTCGSKDYFDCLGRLAAALEPSLLERESGQEETSGLRLATMTTVVVESDFVCRRPNITSAGDIQISFAMSTRSIVEAISDFGLQAQDKTSCDKRNTQLCKDLIVEVQQVLGVQNVYRSSNSVQQEELHNSLVRLLELSANEDGIGALLSGHSVGVAAANHSCHVADDGSLVIPHNWYY